MTERMVTAQELKERNVIMSRYNYIIVKRIQEFFDICIKNKQAIGFNDMIAIESNLRSVISNMEQ